MKVAMDRGALEALGREQLIQEARRFGVRRPEVMTRVELIDEVLRIGTPNPVERKRVRGWLGIARDLVASVVEQGLNLPDAAALIRGDFRFEPLKPVQPPVATVTLAEIYGAQGHFQKAVRMLDEVLAKEPDHEAARKLRDRLERERAASSRAAAATPAGAAVFPEEPEPPTARKPGEELPVFATAYVAPDTTVTKQTELARAEQSEAAVGGGVRVSAAPGGDVEPPTNVGVRGVPPGEDYGGGGRAGMKEDGRAEMKEEDEPLTPRRLSLQPPPRAATIADYDSEPLTPRRSSSKTVEMLEDPEPMTPREQPAALEPEREETKQAESTPAEASVPEPEPSDDEAVLIRTGPTRAVVYFEVRGEHSNGDAPLAHVVEWRSGPTGVERIVYERAIAGHRGTVSVEGLSPDSIVRAAIGRKRHGRFRPFVVCAEATVGSGHPTMVWSPRERKDYGPVVERAARLITA